MSEHEQHAERLEREAADLQRRSDRLGDEIAATREDWHNQQRDDTVPGAHGEPPEELPPPDPHETD